MNANIRCLLERRSVRTYKKDQVSDEALDAILEVGTYAPSAAGKQPGLMVVVQKPELIAELSHMNAHFTDDQSCC